MAFVLEMPFEKPKGDVLHLEDVAFSLSVISSAV